MIADRVYSLLEKCPPALRKAIVAVLSLLGGVSAAIILHYILYRVELPSKPFIYVAF